LIQQKIHPRSQAQKFVISTEVRAFCGRSGETPVLAFAVALAFLSVIPEGNLLLPLPLLKT
jgi:hypothetical protein